MIQHTFLFSDEAVARTYWKDREFKKFAVDVIAGPAKKPTYRRTFYAHTRDAARAVATVKRDALGLPARASFRARLAGPRELGCIETPDRYNAAATNAGRPTGDTARDPHPPTRHCMCDECKPSFDNGANDSGRRYDITRGARDG